MTSTTLSLIPRKRRANFEDLEKDHLFGLHDEGGFGNGFFPGCPFCEADEEDAWDEEEWDAWE
jgi:hypothetical protein